MNSLVMKVALSTAMACVGVDGRVVVRRGIGYGCSTCNTVYAPPVAVVQVPTVGYTYPVGVERFTAERISKLEQIVEGQQVINAQLARLVSGNQAGNVSQSEVAVRAVFTKNCLKCHSGANAKAGMQLDKAEFNVFDRAIISQMVASGEMPPPESGIKLSKADIEVIQSWAGEVADEFRANLRELRLSAPSSNGNGNGKRNGNAPAPIPNPPRTAPVAPDNGTR